MDETDVRLCQMLFVNSRMPIRDMADKLNISVQAVHRRIQTLKDEGLVRRCTASLSIGYLHAVRVLINGISRGIPEDVERALRGNELVQSVFVGEGEPHYFLECIIRDVKELDPLVGYMREKVGIKEPNVMFHSTVKFGDRTLDDRYNGPAQLSRLDYRIICAFHDDARMSVGDIAEKCDASVRTVARHLDRLIADGAIDFYIDWRPGNASGLTALLAIIMKKDADHRAVREELGRRFGGSLFVIAAISNLPGFISSNSWAPSIRAHNDMLDGIRKLEGIENVFSAVLKNGWVQDTWRDNQASDMSKTGK